MKHPIHPLLVHLPVGLWVGSLILDIFYRATGDGGFAAASFYAIGIGIVGAILAAAAGLVELVKIPRNTLPMRIGLTHASLNVVVLSLYVLSFFLRGDFQAGPNLFVTIPQLVLNFISIGILGISGYLGGTLVYQHGIGLRPSEDFQRKLRDEDLTRAA
jgi:uncharacterized membrane protein